jgi:hypothetical protein
LFKDVFLSRDISDGPSFLMQVIVRALSVLAVMFCDGTYAASWQGNRIKFGLVDPKSRPAALLDLTALRERQNCLALAYRLFAWTGLSGLICQQR